MNFFNDKNISKKIEFIPGSELIENVVSPPKPANNYMPAWLKNGEKVNFATARIDENTGEVKNRFVGRCQPFRDAVNAGYIQETWTDLLVRKNNGNVEYFVPTGPMMVKWMNEPSGMSIGSDFYPVEFAFMLVWIPKTPKGYSTLVCPPLNRLDLPFTCTTGIIDSDRFHHASIGQLPFYIKNGYEGIIPAGTPMYQMIPFKRSNWKMDALRHDKKLAEKNTLAARKHFFGTYRRYFWIRKSFE